MKFFGTLYVDLDGVLVDFYRGAEKVLGHPFHHFNKDEMSKKDRDTILGTHETFWKDLPPMPNWWNLWKILRKYDPHILTAVPHWDDRYVYKGKRHWVKQYLHVIPKRVHIVFRHEKHDYAKSGSTQNLLIDDSPKNIDEFVTAGGLGILHKDIPSTTRALQDFGIT